MPVGFPLKRTLFNLKLVKRRAAQHIHSLREQFFSQFATEFLEGCFRFLKFALDSFISPKFAQNCFKYIHYALQVPTVAKGLANQLEGLLLDLCIPMLAMNQKDEENWLQEPSSFLYAQDCRLDGHNNVKYASKDLIDSILRLDDHQGVSLLVKLLDFVRLCFEKGIKVRSNQPLSPHFKECLISILIHCHKFIENDKSASSSVEYIIEYLIVKEMFSNIDIIKARVCTLLQTYGANWIVQTSSLENLCRALENTMSSSHLVVQTMGIVALNKCTANIKVCEYFLAHISQVFDLVVKCMMSIDYKELVCAAEGLIKDFGDSLLPYSVDLLKHFNSSFYQYLLHSKAEADTTDEEEMNPDDESDLEADAQYESIYAAEACLGAIFGILQLSLPEIVRQEANNMVLCMVCDVILEVNSDLFLKSLTLLNLVLYRSSGLNDAMKFFFPILCYVICGRPKMQIHQSASSLPKNFLKVLSDADLSELTEGAISNSLACLMNFVAKMGPEFYTSSDFNGICFAELMFQMIIKVIQDALTGPSDTDIILMLRVVIGILEQSRDKYEIPKFEDYVEMVLDLSQQDRTHSLKQYILQTISMMVWHSPSQTISLLNKSSKLDNFYTYLFGTQHTLQGKATERVLYGLTALLELPVGQLQVVDV